MSEDTVCVKDARERSCIILYVISIFLCSTVHISTSIDRRYILYALIREAILHNTQQFTAIDTWKDSLRTMTKCRWQLKRAAMKDCCWPVCLEERSCWLDRRNSLQQLGIHKFSGSLRFFLFNMGHLWSSTPMKIKAALTGGTRIETKITHPESKNFPARSILYWCRKVWLAPAQVCEGI